LKGGDRAQEIQYAGPADRALAGGEIKGRERLTQKSRKYQISGTGGQAQPRGGGNAADNVPLSGRGRSELSKNVG